MVKNIFISYAWDVEKDEKVIHLAQEINKYEDFKVTFDKWDLDLG